MDTVNKVAAGYHKISEAGQKIDDGDVAEARDTNKDIVRRQKKFFNEIGVLEKDGHDYYLTDRGDELGELLLFNQKDRTNGLYAELFEDWEPTAEIVANAGDDGLDHDELMDTVGLATSTELSTSRKKSGASGLIDLLTAAGLLREESGTYYAADGPRSAETDEGDASQPRPAPQTEGRGPEATTGGAPPVGESFQPETPVTPSSGIDISLDISGDDNPENVRELLIAIREGTEADLDEIADASE